jgi:ubiquinone/menaquinone biosynthesis C-methylase UbiE
MNTNASPEYQREVIAQFTQQAAVPWSKVPPAITNSESLKRLVALSGATGNDTMLDVACGAGVVVCAFAKVVRHATGIDLTPAMLERAGLLERETGLNNVSWQIGAAVPLRFATAAFSIVVSRYAFQHFPDPLAVMNEMARVCQPGDADRIRQIIVEEMESPRMGVGVERKAGAIWFTYPIAVIVAQKEGIGIDAEPAGRSGTPGANYTWRR